jgi:hypothetical protein
VLDESERELQDGMLHGPPPLGPGTAPCTRLIAFGAAMLDRLEANAEILLDAELASAGAWLRSEPRMVHWLHVHTLVAQARPGCDVDYTTDVLLGALSAQVFVHQRRLRDMTLDQLKDGYADLVGKMMTA